MWRCLGRSSFSNKHLPTAQKKQALCPKHDAISSLWVVVRSLGWMRMRMMVWLVEERLVIIEDRITMELRKEKETPRPHCSFLALTSEARRPGCPLSTKGSSARQRERRLTQ